MSSDQSIFPEGLAERLKAGAGKPYRPSNGTEGEFFHEAFCYRCAKQDISTERYCRINGDALAFRVTDPEYPSEWVYGDDGQPKCTAFEQSEGCDG